MIEENRPKNIHDVYHAHLYFDNDTKQIAKQLSIESEKQFGLKVGQFHEKLVGPHLYWSCQIIFESNDFERYVPWLDENRNGLTVLIHAVTGDDLIDHTEYAYWLGSKVEIDISFFNS